MTTADGDAARLAAACRRHWPARPAPVGMARLDRVPDALRPARVPAAACALWRIGTERVVALGADHGACAIGRVTQGFEAELPADDAAVAAMLAVAYIAPDEVPLMPTLPMGHAGIVYGPLDQLPVEPEAVLLFATPRQAMLLSEALGLMAAGAGGLPVTGRPTCMAIPAAIAQGVAAGSLACTGARVYAGFGEDELLVVVPAPALVGLAERLERLFDANEAVRVLAERALAEASAS